jgi:Flp pilus assembly protein TadG
MKNSNTLRKLARDEEGFSLVFVALGFMAFLGVSMLAIDVGMVMTARNQAQNSADASALAGATALAFDNWNDRSATGPAVQNALAAATQNQVMSGAVAITPADVVFLNDPAGINDRVQSHVYRDAAHGNPLSTLIARYFGVATTDVAAIATAEASSANAETCVLPFTIPDKWTEHSDGKGVADGPWNPTSTFDLWYAKGSNQNGGVPLPNPDVYVPSTPSSPGTGFDPMADVGVEMVLKSNNQNQVSPSIYNPWAMPGSTGANDYSNNISTCNSATVTVGDFLTPETGNMVGPTAQGVAALIAEDPNAVWNTDECTPGCVTEGSGPKAPLDPGSRRIGKIPLYDPNIYANGQQSGKSQPQLQVVGYLGFFIETIDGNGNVMGRITPISGVHNPFGPSTGSFAKVIRLVQ